MRVSRPLWMMALLILATSVVRASTEECRASSDGSSTCTESSTDPNPQYQRPSHCQDMLNDCDTRLGDNNSTCYNDFTFMSTNCAKTCRICSTSDPNSQMIANHKHGTVDRIFTAVPQDIQGDKSVETWLKLRETEDYMYNTVYMDDNLADVRVDCQLRHKNCLFWAGLGECTANPNFMITTCAPACQSCRDIKFEYRCPLDTSGPVAHAQPGDLHNMFERILTDPQFAPYEPKALSRPTSSTKDDAPWLIVLENVLTPEECQTMIDLGADRGYKRSSEVGHTIRYDGKRESKLSDRRTSSTTWCKKECINHPTTVAINDRLEEMTGVPRINYEHLQILRYVSY